ncbi:MAG TPA: ATP-binding protein [Methanothrix sp.]|nr:ATP-binding protein [Methanothrix sp.]
MSTSPDDCWTEANKRYLSASLSRLREILVSHCKKDAEQEAANIGEPSAQNPDLVAGIAPGPYSLDILCSAFSLTSFERDILLLCAGIELESDFSSICASAQGNHSRPYPTFGLALAALPDAHWSALTSASPLRRWRMIEIDPNEALTSSRLRIDESVLHFLVGISYNDERLAGLARPLGARADLAPSHRSLADKMAQAWSKAAKKSALPVLQLCGPEAETKRDIASAACRILSLNLDIVTAASIPTDAGELYTFVRLLERKSALHAGAIFLDCEEEDPANLAMARSIKHLLSDILCPLIISTRGMRPEIVSRVSLSFEVSRPKPDEQRLIWQSYLGEAITGMNGQLDAILSQFNLGAGAIKSISEDVQSRMMLDNSSATSQADERQDSSLKAALWDACRRVSSYRMDDLAWRIEPAAYWDDLILPDHQLQVLRSIAMHVRNRSTVYEAWGFARKNSQGMGISALFAGASGTGKTMAAEVLASELRLDLYRIDLSSVVSKYIGETEKNLRRVFDAAEEGGAILLFDEADALFGKRSEIRDSHDRYANIEVSYLLQKMEAYRGLAILTTNMKNALDTAFLRRIRFVVQFPFPDFAERALIWKRMFPDETPTQGLDFTKLSRLNVAGGNIKNIALNAAFLAADAGVPVGMAHIKRAASAEYAKLDRPLTEAEIGGWL